MTQNLTAGETYRDATGAAFTPTACQSGAPAGHALTADCFDLARAYSAPMCQPLPTPAGQLDDDAPHYCEPCERAGDRVEALGLRELGGDTREAVCAAHAVGSDQPARRVLTFTGTPAELLRYLADALDAGIEL